jgi:hypothetical protein
LVYFLLFKCRFFSKVQGQGADAWLAPAGASGDMPTAVEVMAYSLGVDMI